MPSKSKRKDIIWPEDDVIELLAQLDLLVAWQQGSSCLLTEDQRKEEEAEIILQLSKKIDGKYVPGQVKKMLFNLYRKGDMNEFYKTNFSIVFRRGSSEMRALDDSARERIKDRYEQLYAWIPRTKRSSSKHPTPSKLTVPPTPPAQRTLHTRMNNPKRISRISPSVVITPIKQEGSTITRPHIDPLLERTEVRDSMEEDSHRSSSSELAANTLLTPDTSRFDYTHTTVREVLKPLQPVPGIMLDIQEHEDLMHELSYFRQKWEQAEIDIEQLKRESREKEALTAKTYSVSFSFEAEIKRKNARIADLESQVSRQAFLQPYLDLESGELNAETLGEIRSKASILAKRIAAIDLTSGLEYPNEEGMTIEWSSGLVELANPALGRNVHGPVHRISDLIDPNIPPQRFIQALIGAAVCEKVFRQEIKCIQMMSTSLLDEYRNHIAAACDKNVLRSLDFASHRSVIRSEQFQNNVLPRKAKALAERHLEILAPFIAEKEKAECTEKLRWRLEGIFTIALDLKVLLMTTKDMFECIWPAPGSDFDVDIMETARPRRQEIVQYNQTESPRVVLPVTPGLRVYSNDRQMVDHNGFRKVGDHVNGQQSIVAKSVVYV
ncbi:hypothetical protein N0V90_004808 [Kalmusia sp. IMI 367209]|nr:hypothetical protein N0V90_004808 [Kalmusia sp. IMI 367209]